MKKFSAWLKSRNGKIFKGGGYSLGAILLLIGAISKLTHWLPSAGSNILTAIGFIIGVFLNLLDDVAVPGTKDADTNSDSEDIVSKPKTISLISGLGSLLFLVGAILLTTHWIPNLWANLLILVSYGLQLITLMIDASRKIRKK